MAQRSTQAAFTEVRTTCEVHATTTRPEHVCVQPHPATNSRRRPETQMDPGLQLIVITDVDRVLFETNANPGPSLTRLRRIGRQGIPVILWSSRTRAELEWVRAELGISDPFFVENGSALYLPRNYFAAVPLVAYDVGEHHVLEFGCSHRQAVRQLHTIATQLGIATIGWSEQSVSDIAREGGISRACAPLAKLRRHDEPFRGTGLGTGESGATDARAASGGAVRHQFGPLRPRERCRGSACRSEPASRALRGSGSRPCDHGWLRQRRESPAAAAGS